MVPNFSKFDNKTLPLKDIVFKRDRLQTDFKKLCFPNEDYDLAHNNGLYHLHSDFNIGILMNMVDPDSDDEIV